MTEVRLYNRTRLPKLPDRNIEKYPYAFISYFYSSASGSAEPRFDLKFLANRPVYRGDRFVYPAGDMQSHVMRASNGANWEIAFNGSNRYDTSLNTSTQTIIWTNVDVYNEDNGSIGFRGSEPISIGGEWDFKAPPLYVFSDHTLPQLPKWDKAKYPYAVIRFIESQSWTSHNRYVLYVFSGYPTINGNFVQGGNGFGWCGSYALCDGSFEWGRLGESDGICTTLQKIYAVWANVDILNEDGTVYLAASEAIPISAIDYKARIQGWFVGKRLAAMRGQTQQVVDTARLGLATLGRMILGKE